MEWKRPKRYRSALLAVALAAGLAALGWIAAGPILLSMAERDFAAAYARERPFAARVPGAAHGILLEGRGAVPGDRLTGAFRKILAAQRFPHNQARAQLLLGRLALLNGDLDGAAERYLRAARSGAPESTAGAEFGAALLVRAQRHRRPVDLAAALEHVGRAHRFAPRNAVDSFNLALLYESIPAPHLARDEWARCLRLETDRQWLGEARRRHDAVNARIDQRAATMAAIKSGPAEYLRVAGGRRAAEAALEEAAPGWLARQKNDPSAAQALRVLAAQLESAHGDPWLSDLVRASDNPAAGRAFELLADACVRNRNGQHQDAARFAAEAREHFATLRIAAGEFRARLEAVVASHRAGAGNCLEPAQSLKRDLDRTPYSWIKAYTALEETTCQSMAGSPGRLVRQREHLLGWIRQTGFEGLELRALGFLAQPELVRANPAQLWRIVVEGLGRFWERNLPASRAQQLYMAAAIAGRDGAFPLASVAMAREGIRVMQEAGNPQWQALCRSLLGSIELAAGFDQDAAETFRAAEQFFAQAPQNEVVRRYRLEAATMRAEAEVSSGNPAAAIARLSGMVNDFSAFGDTWETAPFGQVMGLAHLRAGRYSEAASAFDEVIRRARMTLEGVGDQRHRDGLLQSADAAFRGQMLLKLVRDRDPAGAFELWRCLRAERRPAAATETESVPDGALLLGVVALPGGWAVFAADEGSVDAKWIPAERTPLDALARSFTERCSSPSSSIQEIDRAGRPIYDAVISPFEKRLAGKTLLVISADGPLAGAPWTALPDSRGGRLIDRQPVVIGDLGRLARGPAAQGERPLVVVAPALSSQLSAVYPPLGDSLREAKEIVRRFPDAVVLGGRAATAQALKENLPRSTFFHFGGHGTANGGYGAILLAPAAGSDGLFDAAQIGELDLSGVRVVSLASCSSGAGEAAGPVNPDSLVHALLDAGVRNVIAAPWNVDSESTSELFGEFYGRMASAGSTAEAFRQACLKVRARVGGGHPYFWSGFQIYGEAN